MNLFSIRIFHFSSVDGERFLGIPYFFSPYDICVGDLCEFLSVLLQEKEGGGYHESGRIGQL